MVRKSFLILFSLLLISFGSCDRGSQDPVSDEPGGTQVAEDPDPALSTAERTVQTMLAAAAAKDLERLSDCFSDYCEKEFLPFRKKTATTEQLDEFADFVAGAEILDAAQLDYSGTVRVKFRDREENIQLGKSEWGWQIEGF